MYKKWRQNFQWKFKSRESVGSRFKLGSQINFHLREFPEKQAYLFGYVICQTPGRQSNSLILSGFLPQIGREKRT